MPSRHYWPSRAGPTLNRTKSWQHFKGFMISSVSLWAWIGEPQAPPVCVERASRKPGNRPVSTQGERIEDIGAVDRRQQAMRGAAGSWSRGRAGKTRLAVELIRRQNQQGWDAGFLRKDAIEVNSLVKGGDPLLVAVDYAETRTRQVLDLLRTVATYTKTDLRPKVRVMLLARTSGDWSSHLLTEDSEIELLVDQGPPPLALEPLAVSERLATWQEAVHRFAAVLGRPLQTSAHEEQAYISKLPSLPLYVQMAGP
jgi:hypothetical protein